MWFLNHQPTSFVQIPLASVRGRLYASPMPFGPYDTRNRLLATYLKHHIRCVIMLVTPSEIEAKARRDLRAVYLKNKLEFIHCPIQDYTAPTLDVLTPLIEQAAEKLSHTNVVVHCNAGVGRTGVVLACILSRIQQIPPDQALRTLSSLMSIRTTDEQERLAMAWYQSLAPSTALCS